MASLVHASARIGGLLALFDAATPPEALDLWLLELAEERAGDALERRPPPGRWREAALALPWLADFLRATAHLLAGRWSALSNAGPANEHPNAKGDRGIGGTAERIAAAQLALLRYLAAARRGEVEASVVRKEVLDERTSALDPVDANAILCVLRLEEAARRMGRGGYAECLQKLAGAEADIVAAGSVWEYRLLLVRGTCRQARGEYDACAVDISLQESLSPLSRSPYFRLPTLRRRLSLLVESERYHEAREFALLHSEAFSHSDLQTTHVLFVQERARLDLALGHVQRASDHLAHVRSLVETFDLPRGLTTLIEEQCEVLLATLEADAVLTEVRAQLWKAQLGGDLGGQCAVLMILGRALLLKGLLLESRTAIESSLLIARAQGYGRARVRGLILRGVVLGKEGNTADAVTSFRQAEAEADALGLRASVQVSRALRAEASGATIPLTLLRDIRSTFGGFGVLERLGDTLSATFRTRVVVRAFDGGPARTLGARAYLEERESHTGIDFWLAEGLLDVGNGRARRVIACEGQRAALLSRLLDAGAGGVEPSALFRAMEPRIPYHPINHAARLSGEVSRLRRVLADAGVALSFDRKAGRYALAATAPMRIVEALSGDVRTETRLTPLERRILEILAGEGRMATTTLRGRLGGVSRQALHPALRKLVAEGHAEMRFRGRSSFYIFRSGDGRPPAPEGSAAPSIAANSSTK